MSIEKPLEGLVKRLHSAENSIAMTEGPFVLYVLSEREAAPGKWDLLVSALWLETSSKGIQQMVDALKPFLKPTDWLQLASITPLSPTMEYVQWITRKYRLQHATEEVSNSYWDGEFISHAFLMTAMSSAVGTDQLIAA